jgi:TolA-binding protein
MANDDSGRRRYTDSEWKGTVNAQLTQLDRRQERMAGGQTANSQQIGALTGKLSTHEARCEELHKQNETFRMDCDKNFKKLEQKIDHVEHGISDLRTDFKVALAKSTLIISIVASVASLVAGAAMSYFLK